MAWREVCGSCCCRGHYCDLSSLSAWWPGRRLPWRDAGDAWFRRAEGRAGAGVRSGGFGFGYLLARFGGGASPWRCGDGVGVRCSRPGGRGVGRMPARVRFHRHRSRWGPAVPPPGVLCLLGSEHRGSAWDWPSHNGHGRRRLRARDARRRRCGGRVVDGDGIRAYRGDLGGRAVPGVWRAGDVAGGRSGHPGAVVGTPASGSRWCLCC